MELREFHNQVHPPAGKRKRVCKIMCMFMIMDNMFIPDEVRWQSVHRRVNVCLLL